MKKLSTILCTLALLFIGVGGAKAERVYANPASATQTWTDASNTFTWNGTSNNFISTGLPTGDISAYTNFHCTVSGFSENANFIRLVLKNGKDNQITEYINAGEYNVDLVSKYPSWDFTCVTDFLIFGSNSATAEHSIDNDHPASAVITDIYIEKPNEFVFDAVGKASINKTGLTAAGGLTYNPATGVLTSNGKDGTLTLELATPTDLRNVFHFNVTRSGAEGSDDIVNKLCFYDEDNTLINTWNSIKWSNTWNASGIDNNATNAFINNKPVKKLVWVSDEEAAKASKTLTITSVEFTLKTMSCVKAGETQLKTLAWNKIDGSSTETPDWNMNGSSDTYYGNYSGDATHYSDLTAYSELRVYCKDNNTGFRCFFINAEGTATYTVSTTAATWHAEEKYYSLDLSTITKWESKVALKAMKAENGGGPGERYVKNIFVYKTPDANAAQYILTGSGMQLEETVAALADATATSIDATGVTGITTNSEAGRTLLTSANPNCLFLGTTGNGGLANTQNVITSDACAQLVLTDGYPFKAPVAFTATAAPIYNRAFTANTTTTVCLPFALTSTEASSLGTFYELSSFDGSTLKFTSVDAPAANTPYLVMPTATALTMSETDKSIVVTPASLGTGATIDNIEFIGTLDATTIPASDGDYSYFAYNNGGLVKITTKAATLPAFRGYFKVTTSAISGARSLNISFDDETTGVKTINRESFAVDQYYDLQGRRVAQPTKGLYIVNGKKVIK